MKKIIVFIVFIAFAFGVYYFQNDEGYETMTFRDDFDTFNDAFWYPATWDSPLENKDQVEVSRGLMSLKINKTDQGPYLLSKPITVEKGSRLTIKRRVQLKPTDQPFAGGLALFETQDKGLIPSVLNDGKTSLGDGIVLVEYITQAPKNSTRPGDNTFRVLPRSWQRQATIDFHPEVVAEVFKNNYALVPAKFNQWIEETLVYDSETGRIDYSLGGEHYSVRGPLIKSDKVRIFIHGYGFSSGHEVVMDWIDVKVE